MSERTSENADSAAILKRLLPGARHEETHLSHVFITPSDVYKLKKPLTLPFADFSTPPLRRAACENEIAVNAPFAPRLYRGVVPLLSGPEGERIGEEDTPARTDAVDWLVHMVPFAAEGRLDKRLARGEAPGTALTALTDRIYRGHEEAAPVTDPGWPETISGWIEDIGGTLAPLAGAAEAEAWRHAASSFFDGHAALLRERGEGGALRPCHGDLHLKNICTMDDTLVPYDALEFDPVMTRIDPLYDIAFLIMDLVRAEEIRAANAVMNRYLGLLGAYEAALLLPGYLALRAGIRAMAEMLSGREEDGRAYLASAFQFFEGTRTPLQLLIGGRSGTGKSTLAAALAPEMPPPPGAIHLRSDVIRKRLFGVMPEEKLGPSGYEEGVSGKVYAVMRTGFDALAGKIPLIADATFLERDAAFGGTDTVRIWLTAEDNVLEARLAARRGDASDADAAVMRHQAAAAPAGPWQIVKTGQGAEAALADLRRAVGFASPQGTGPQDD